MSCYEWESGEIIIPTKAWSGLRKAVLDAHNGMQAERLKLAQRVHAALVAATGGKTQPSGHNIYTILSGGAHRPLLQEVAAIDWHELQRTVMQHEGGQPTGKLRRPKPSDFPMANGKKLEFGEGDFAVTLNPEKRSCHWEVYENNHAVTAARRHVIGKALFSALAKITWTRGTGGSIAGGNEHTSGDQSVGGGANCQTASFGPLGERDNPLAQIRKQLEARAKRAAKSAQQAQRSQSSAALAMRADTASAMVKPKAATHQPMANKSQMRLF